MDGKKISFGFKKTKKVEKLFSNSEEEKKEFIECMEEKSIKVIGGETVTEDLPLVIPLKPNTLITAERLKEIAEKVESAVVEPEIKQEPISAEEKAPENETIEQMAVRELMQEAKKQVKVESQDITIPTPAKVVVTGEKESTLDDYEAVPIQQFGMAMLRGMGWTPDKDGTKYKQPELRPKGLGLGADKVIKDKQKKQSRDNKEEDLAIVQNSFVKITTGKYSGYYGKVVSLDEDNGRVMVDISVKKETVSLSEFMMHAVTKSEFDRESKVINAESFDEYKKNEKRPHKSSDQDEKASSSQRNNKDRSVDDHRKQRDETSSNGRNRRKERDRNDSSSSEDRSRRRKKKDKKRYSSSDSLSSLSDHEKKHKRKNKSRKRSTSDSSDAKHKSPTPKGKRDIDKKRKGKKKKRDRDRSPNYKKHRK